MTLAPTTSLGGSDRHNNGVTAAATAVEGDLLLLQYQQSTKEDPMSAQATIVKEPALDQVTLDALLHRSTSRTPGA